MSQNKYETDFKLKVGKGSSNLDIGKSVIFDFYEGDYYAIEDVNNCFDKERIVDDYKSCIKDLCREEYDSLGEDEKADAIINLFAMAEEEETVRVLDTYVDFEKVYDIFKDEIRIIEDGVYLIY